MYNKEFQLKAYNYTHNRNFVNRPSSWSSYYNRNSTGSVQPQMPNMNYKPYNGNPNIHMNRYQRTTPYQQVNTFNPRGVNLYGPQVIPVPYVVNQYVPNQIQPNQYMNQMPPQYMYNPNPNANINTSTYNTSSRNFNTQSITKNTELDLNQEDELDAFKSKKLREINKRGKYSTFDLYTDVIWWNGEEEDGWPGTHKVKPDEIYYGIIHYYFTPYDGLILLVDKKVEGSVSITDLPPSFMKTTIKDSFKLDHLLKFRLKQPLEFDEKGRPKFIPIFGDYDDKRYNFRSRVRGTPIFFTNSMGVFKLEDNQTYVQVFLVNTGVHLTYPIEFRMVQFFKPGELIEMEVLKGPTEPRASGYLCRIPFDSVKSQELKMSYKMINEVEFEGKPGEQLKEDLLEYKRSNDTREDINNNKENKERQNTPPKYEPKFYVNEYEKLLPYESESCTLKNCVKKIGGNLKVVLGYISLKIKSVVNPSTIVSTTMAKMLVNFVKGKTAFEVDKSTEEFEFLKFKEANDSMTAKRAPVVAIIGGPGEGKSALFETMCNIKSDTKSNFNFSTINVEQNGEKITMFDTPGNELLAPIRNNIVKASDLAIIVISAETGVNKVTKECIDLCRKNNLPFLFVLTKFDLSSQNKIENVITDLSDMGLMVEQIGGDLQMIVFSTEQDTEVNKNNILDAVVLESSVSDKIEYESSVSQSIKGNGFILDSGKNKNFGFYSLMLMKNGELKKGDYVLSGLDSTKIKYIRNKEGELLDSLKASESGYVYGFDKETTPNPGDEYVVFAKEDEAKEISEEKRLKKTEQEINEQMINRVTAALDFIDQKDNSDNVKYVPVVIRCDVKALVEPTKIAIENLKCVGATSICKYKVVDANIGNFTMEDSNVLDNQGLVIAYKTSVSNTLENKLNKLNLKVIKEENIDDVIVKAEEQLEQFLGEKKLGRLMGTAQILKIFEASKKRNAAGCVVTYGRIQPFYDFRVMRGNKVIFYGKISSLRRTTEEASEILETESCGITFEGFNDFKVGDVIEAYTD